VRHHISSPGFSVDWGSRAGKPFLLTSGLIPVSLPFGVRVDCVLENAPPCVFFLLTVLPLLLESVSFPGHFFVSKYLFFFPDAVSMESSEIQALFFFVSKKGPLVEVRVLVRKKPLWELTFSSQVLNFLSLRYLAFAQRGIYFSPFRDFSLLDFFFFFFLATSFACAEHFIPSLRQSLFSRFLSVTIV